MIPADVASRLRLVTPDQPAPPQPAAPTRQLTDVLSDLVPGQRVLAEIQALLPNGTYRAMVAQRDVTLALPFSAKPGDSLELEVVESDGKMALAFVANRGAKDQGSPAGESASATLSATGKLIGNLLSNVDDPGKRAAPAVLNGQQPLIEEFPKDAAQLAPILKDALSTSGMFYEAHQARWAEGTLPTAVLFQEPQGKLSPALQAPSSAPAQANESKPLSEPPSAGSLPPPAKEHMAAASSSTSPSSQNPSAANPIPADLTPLVRQQLDALATQTYVWQGQVWPGQQMRWEIQEDREERRQNHEGDDPAQWQTRLQLRLPALGGIDATMRLHPGGMVDLTLVTDNEQSRQALAAAADALRRQLDGAGLSLSGLTVRHDEAAA